MKTSRSLPVGMILCCILLSGAPGRAGAESAPGLPKTFAEFEQSAATGAGAPTGLPDPLKVMWLSKAGQWNAAHDIAEKLKTRTGSWVHAFLHREEGDRGNAGYWYRRAGMTLPAESVSIAEEWGVLSRELWQREYGIAAGQEACTSPGGLTAASVKGADGKEGSWDTVVRRDGREVLRIPHARPLSFSPAGEVLLLAEAAPDDDLRHFLVRPAPGAAVPAFGARKRFGGRQVIGHAWSEDGLSLTLSSAASTTETVVVAEHLKAK